MAETIPDYDELELRLQRGREGSYRVWATGPDGSRGSEDFALPFSEEERKIFVLTVGAARNGVRGFRTPQMETAKRFGSELCDALLTGNVRDVYTSARRIADENNRGLRVTLHLSEVPELMGIPWEFLYELEWVEAATLAELEQLPGPVAEAIEAVDWHERTYEVSFLIARRRQPASSRIRRPSNRLRRRLSGRLHEWTG